MNRRRSPAIRNPAAEAQLFRRRALLGFVVATLGLLLLAGWYFHLQVLEHEQYATRSEANRIKQRPIVPGRGLIHDRAGRLLADNVPAYRLEIVAEEVRDIEATLRGLAEILPVSDEELQRYRAARQATRGFRAVPLKLRLEEAEVARFAVNRHRFPGVDVVPYLTRRYPYGELFAHVVGYVGRVDEADLQRLGDRRYSVLTHVGKTGIEFQYEERLRGEIGHERVEQNVRGRDIRVLAREPGRPGQDLYLSIDARLQQATIDAFEGQHGAAVVVDPRSGEILAMVSLPAFDPNLFVGGISVSDYRALMDSPSQPMFNRVVRGGYEPGSTIKPFVALAGLAEGIVRPETTVLSTGAYRLPGQSREYRDWRPGGHGRINLVESLAQSVNTYYYHLAVELGIERLGRHMRDFGFGAPTGVDLPGESAGILPSPEWKRSARNEPWYPGETVISGIGQGFWVTTPLQLAQGTAIIAARGEHHPLHLLRESQDGFGAERMPEPIAAPRRVVANAEHLAAVDRGLVAVMHSPTGTARATAQGLEYHIAGKTGTAQRVTRRGDTSTSLDNLPFHLRHRALFMAYAPAEDPQLALALVVESGGSGSRAAAPVARRIFDAWLTRREEQ